MSDKKLLIVSEIGQALKDAIISAVLAKADQIETAATNDGAIVMMKSFKPDVIFVDATQDEKLGGPELVKKIKQEDFKGSIVAICPSSKMNERMIEAGAEAMAGVGTEQKIDDYLKESGFLQ